MLLYKASRPYDKLYVCFNVHNCSSGLILLIIANNWAIFFLVGVLEWILVGLHILYFDNQTLFITNCFLSI